MSLLSKEAILSINDLQTEDVEVPEWQGKARVRTLTGAERDYFEEKVTEIKGDNVTIKMKGFKVLLVALTLIDENGNNLFTVDEVDKLNNKSSKAIDRIFLVSQRLNGIGEKDVEDLIKN